MKKNLICLLCYGLFCTSAQAAPHLSDFPLGITKDVVEFKATEPCADFTTKQGEDSFCAKVSFGGKDWQGTFLFEDNLLEIITLTGKPDPSYIDAALDGYQHSPYVLVRADASTQSCDIIALARTGNSEEEIQLQLQEISASIAGKPQDSVTYIYVEQSVYEALLEATEREVVAEFPKSPVSGFTVGNKGVHVVIMDLECMLKRGVTATTTQVNSAKAPTSTLSQTPEASSPQAK